ncbi:hypothetical protein OG906_33160 [Streptomyces sp. NBC_01426]|uniref:hypothetical protein n=1 Tax=Streptomyces sp. NBC_01426 TaxID=2975866 RepID=UPI002E3365C8|nr:hypothetical protein [Streptomyces sp. NBC_01426]
MAFVPLFVLAGLLLGPGAASAAAAAPTVRQAPVTVALSQGGLSSRAGAVTGIQAPKSAPVLATTGNKKAKKSKKKGGFFKTLLIVIIVVIVLLVVLYGVRRALRRRSS